ncbi:NTP transferase domain-containing protein [bacterium]|nr:NTP transferase domain-containing protein [bacterium]
MGNGPPGMGENQDDTKPGSQMHYAVIMAGGIGTRFWPMSTPRRPKQLLKLFRDKTMIELTLDRITPLIPLERQRIVTVAEQIPLFKEALPQLTDNNFIVEPFGRNTAPCIGLAALHLQEEDPEAVMVVLPADHLIQDEEGFRKCLQTGIDAVESKDAIVTLGIQPRRPETGYGYIQFEADEVQDGLHRVVTFAEKPNEATAKRFIESGEFLWNSGIYIWSARRILSEIEDFLPELYVALDNIQLCIGKEDERYQTFSAYNSIKPISIDYGVMERTQNAYVVRGVFDWSDVGNWGEVWRLSQKDEKKNATHGKVLAIDSSSSYIYTDRERPVAVVGLDHVVVVSTADGLLVCPLEDVQKVREAAEESFRLWGNNDEKKA